MPSLSSVEELFFAALSNMSGYIPDFERLLESTGLFLI
jgi:hypothetical protein